MALPTFVPELSSLPPLPTAECSVADLCARYSIARQSLYPRLNACGVSGEKRSHRTFFSPADVFRLDACHHYLSLGYGLKEVAGQVSGAEQVDETSLPSAPVVSPIDTFSSALVEALKTAIPSVEQSPLTRHRELQEIADHGWVVTTSVLAQVLGFSNSTLHGFNAVEERCGFRLERCGVGRFKVFSLDL